MQIYQKSRLKMFRISTPDNYFANQYSTDENSAQPVPADFSTTS